jgi:Tfp pilus assembly protein PilP
MKLTIGILAVGLMTGAVWAQSPQIINNGQNTAKAPTQAAKPVASAPAKPAGAAAKAASAPAKPVSATAAGAHPATVTVAAKPHKPQAPHKQVVLHPTAAAKGTAPKTAIPAKTKITAEPSADSVSKVAEAPKPPKPEEKKWSMTGKRDPFFSPVVQAPTGSGCATGKKCLEIGQINLRGVVKSDGGFIAVVTNSLNKAYFLRENDPVFNGYVVRITGDSVVFQETVQDKLGKPLTREVVKRIFTPAV